MNVRNQPQYFVSIKKQGIFGGEMKRGLGSLRTFIFFFKIIENI